MSESSLCFTNVKQRYGRPAPDLTKEIEKTQETGNPQGLRSSVIYPEALQRGPKPSRAATPSGY